MIIIVVGCGRLLNLVVDVVLSTLLCWLLIEGFRFAIGSNGLLILQSGVKLILGILWVLLWNLLICRLLLARNLPSVIQINIGLRLGFIIGFVIHAINWASILFLISLLLLALIFILFIIGFARTADKYEHKWNDDNKSDNDCKKNFPAHSQIGDIFEESPSGFWIFRPPIDLRLIDFLNYGRFWITLLPRLFNLIPDGFWILAQYSTWICKLQQRVFWVWSHQILPLFPKVTTCGALCWLES